MKARFTVLPVLLVSVALSAASCGGRDENPAAPGAAPPVAAASGEDEVVDLAYDGSDVAASSHVSIGPWRFTDACADQRGIRFRLFDMTRGLQTKIFKIRSGGAKQFRLACYTNDKICVGGEQDPPAGLTFGVRLDGTGKQSKAACKPCTTRGAQIRFTCTRRFAGEPDTVIDEDELAAEE